MKAWLQKRIAEVCSFSGGYGFRPTDWSKSGLPIIRIQNLNGSKEFHYYSGKSDERWLVRPGELLFSWAGVRGVSFGPTIWPGPLAVLNQHIYRVHPKSGVDKEWLYLALKTVTSRIEARAHGFKSSLVHVRKSEIDAQLVMVPCLEEQRYIAKVFRTWDLAIRALEDLLRAKRERKRGLMQQLLTGKRRFKQFKDEPWNRVALSDILEQVTRRNTIACKRILTGSSNQGLIDQQQFYSRRIASEDVSRYYLMRRGEFAYNRSSAIGYPFGATKRLDEYDEGVLSTLYLVFRIKGGAPVDSNYLSHTFDGGVFNEQLIRLCREGARSHGLLNITAHEYFSMQVRLPPLKEQRRIEAVLSTCDRELVMLQKQFDALDQQRRGLMERMLSGQIRAQVFKGG